MKDQQKESLHYIHLSDYKKFDYSIPEIFIDFNIKNDHVKVITEYKFIKENPKSNSLKLKGDQIRIISIFIDNEELNENRYCLLYTSPSPRDE